ncbi:MAG: GNAT family N-acetyltransferase [Sphingomonadales bacterium]
MKIVETERLTLRHVTTGDGEFILRLLNEPSFKRFIGDRGVRTRDDAREYISQRLIASYDRFGFGMYMAELKGDGTPIGNCGLVKRETLADVDIGFAFVPEFWGQGYAIEAARAVMAYAKDALGLARIAAITAPDNHASIRVLEKLGLKFERMVALSRGEPEIRLYARND